MFCQFVLLFVAAASVGRVTCDPSSPAVISHLYSEYVLDGSEHRVKLQPFTDSDSQYWIREPVGRGKHLLINKASGKVLDIEYEADGTAKVITSEKHGGMIQQWYVNADDTIESAIHPGGLVLDIPDRDIQPEKEIIVFPKHGESNQKFRFGKRVEHE